MRLFLFVRSEYDNPSADDLDEMRRLLTDITKSSACVGYEIGEAEEASNALEVQLDQI